MFGRRASGAHCPAMSVAELAKLGLAGLVAGLVIWSGYLLLRQVVDKAAKLIAAGLESFRDGQREQAETIRDGFSALVQGQAEHGERLAAIEARLAQPQNGLRVLPKRGLP